MRWGLQPCLPHGVVRTQGLPQVVASAGRAPCFAGILLRGTEGKTPEAQAAEQGAPSPVQGPQDRVQRWVGRRRGVDIAAPEGALSGHASLMQGLLLHSTAPLPTLGRAQPLLTEALLSPTAQGGLLSAQRRGGSDLAGRPQDRGACLDQMATPWVLDIRETFSTI